MGINTKRLFIPAGLAIFLIVAFILVQPTFTPKCSNGQPAHTSLATSSEPTLRKLSEYETQCKGAVTDTTMLFTAMPTSLGEADEFARVTSTRLKEFARRDVTPLVVFEPSTSIPTIISDIHDNKYDEVLVSYFETLKNLGLRDKHMGTWVLFPEANTPTWHNTDPAIFASNVTRVAAMQREVFPDVKLSILLNSTTYPSNDTDWSDGKQRDLRPYVASIPKGTLSSFGYQGFPFATPANAPQPYTQFDGKALLPTHLARDAAATLQTKNIWINTGTFSRIYTNNPAEQVIQSPAQRQQTLTGVIEQATALQAQGFALSVNLFAEDKSNTNERIDWSYWQTGKQAESPHTRVLQMFFEQLHQRQISTSLYDTI